MSLDRTHDPKRKSWGVSANVLDCDFPIQNLPFGVFSAAGSGPRVGIAIGDQILDLALIEEKRLISVPDGPLFNRPDVNAFMARGPRGMDARAPGAERSARGLQCPPAR
jgi:fumarylacetoacetase